MHSIKKMSYLAFVGVAGLLVFVIILGIRQHQLNARYNTIITQSENMIFQFSTIREQITTSLIEKNWEKVDQAADQLKNLNSSVARLQENTLIPGEYRLDMAKQMDLSGLAIASKKILASSDKVAHSLVLQDKMRSLAEYLIQFDRIIVSQMRAKVVQFQTIMIGVLGTIICLITFSLILLYKKTILPLLHLTKQTEDVDIFANGLSCDPDVCTEVTLLTDSVNALLERSKENKESETDWLVDENQLAIIINESTNLSNGIINYAQLLSDTYREVDMGAEETKILRNIIDAAERIAQLNKEIRK
ncbi:MAG: hypothetical protein K9K37_07315 [Desulfocapsa sp.]|nr:hypothetical protein [Desulfocapsa sp.]